MKSLVFSARHFRNDSRNNKLLLLKNNANLIFLCMVFIVGIVVGTFATIATDKDTLNILDFLFLTNFKARMEQSLIYTFSATLSSSFVFLLMNFLLGLTLWGFLIIPSVSFFKGYGLGLSLGYIYGVYKIKGILFNLLVMLPSALIISVSVILFSRLSMIFSFKLCKSAFIKRSVNQILIKNYLVKFAFFIIIIAVGAGVDMLFTALFSGLFSF